MEVMRGAGGRRGGGGREEKGAGAGAESIRECVCVGGGWGGGGGGGNYPILMLHSLVRNKDTVTPCARTTTFEGKGESNRN